jgi:hypothetical protein
MHLGLPSETKTSENKKSISNTVCNWNNAPDCTVGQGGDVCLSFFVFLKMFGGV